MDTKVLPPETTLVYENYKMPLKKFEDGFGYVGTLAQNEEKTHVQCHYCGYLYSALGRHVKKAHGVTALEYRKKLGLNLNTALIADNTRDKMVVGRRSANKPEKGQLKEGLAQYWEDVKAGLIVHDYKKKQSAAHTLERQNELGVCPDQVLEKIRDLGIKLGRTPSSDEFSAEYNHRYVSSVAYHFGRWTKAVEMAGYIPIVKARQKRYAKIKLKAYLKNFYKEYKRSPQRSDWKRGLLPPEYEYRKWWGTLNDARLAAGIPAIIPITGGRYYELSPDQMIEYQRMVDENPDRHKRNNQKMLADIVGEPKLA